MSKKELEKEVLKHIKESQKELNEHIDILCEAVKLNYSNVSLEPTRRALKKIKRTLDFIETLKG